MEFQVSPGVLVKEKDLTNVIPAIATTIGAVAGQFSQGPMEEITTISSEKELVETFGKPDSSTFEYFFSAASFLQYSSSLRVVRAANSGSVNAVVSGTALQIKNTDHYQNGDGSTGPYNNGSANVGEWAARTAGVHGNSLSVSVCPSANAYEMAAKTTTNDASTAVGDTTIVLTSGTDFAVGDIVNFAEAGGHEYRVTAVNTNTLTFVRHPSGTGGLQTAVANGSAVRRRWKYYDLVDTAPGTSTYTSTRSGSGETLTTDGFSIGFNDVTTSYQTVFLLTQSSGTYTSMTLKGELKGNATQGSTVNVTVKMTLNDADSGDGTFTDGNTSSVDQFANFIGTTDFATKLMLPTTAQGLDPVYTLSGSAETSNTTS